MAIAAPVTKDRFRANAMIQIPLNPAENQECQISRLKKRVPWPDGLTSIRSVDWQLDAGGRKLVSDLIQQLPPGSVVLEIGSFLGGSAKQWLECSDDITLICVDPWKIQNSIRRFAAMKGQPEWVVKQLDAPNGIYKTFLKNTWEYRDRIIPVRGYSQDVLPWLASAGISPDLIYLDADKTGREINPCHKLFPNAKITGDDWWHGVDRWWRADEGYPIRKPVREFCKRHNFFLRTEKMTWVIDHQRPPVSYQLKRPLYHFKSVRRRMRGLFRATIGRN